MCPFIPRFVTLNSPSEKLQIPKRKKIKNGNHKDRDETKKKTKGRKT